MISTSEIISYLQNCGLFLDMSDAKILNILKSSHYTLKEYKESDTIFIEGDKCTHLSIILTGTIEIQKIDSNGNLLVISSLTSYDTFGENLLFGDIFNYPMNVSSKTPSTIIHINKDYIYKMCLDSETFLKNLLRSLSNKALNLNLKLKEISMKSLRQMICNFLINEYAKTKNPIINLKMTKKDWANALGVQRPSLSRELKKLKDEGIIDYDKSQIKILNLQNLKYYLYN